jgi:hypothetical protein
MEILLASDRMDNYGCLKWFVIWCGFLTAAVAKMGELCLLLLSRFSCNSSAFPSARCCFLFFARAMNWSLSVDWLRMEGKGENSEGKGMDRQ